jgi:membrane associated rhomboid family serine protease
MRETGQVPTCHIHPKVETGRSCTRCGRPACPNCLHDAAVGSHCTTCIKEQRAPLSQAVTKGVTRNVRSLRVMELPITKSIMAINVAVFFMTEWISRSTSSPVNQANLALNAIQIHDGQWWRLITSGFLHFGFFHIGMNMAVFYRLGETFENTLGPWRYIGLYAVCLLGGSAGAVLLDPVGGMTGGASGAVFGLAAAAVVALRQRGVSFANTQWGPLLAINLVITFMVPQISKGGHLGGLMFGAVAGGVLLHPRRRGHSLPQDLLILGALIALAVALAFTFSTMRVNNLVGLRP